MNDCSVDKIYEMMHNLLDDVVDKEIVSDDNYLALYHVLDKDATDAFVMFLKDVAESVRYCNSYK